MKTQYEIGEAQEDHAFITDKKTGNDVAVIRRGDKCQPVTDNDWQNIIDSIQKGLTQ